MSVSHPLAGRRKQQTKGLCTLGARRIKRTRKCQTVAGEYAASRRRGYVTKQRCCSVMHKFIQKTMNSTLSGDDEKKEENFFITSFIVSSEYMKNSESCINQRVTSAKAILVTLAQPTVPRQSCQQLCCVQNSSSQTTTAELFGDTFPNTVLQVICLCSIGIKLLQWRRLGL